jgi:hypothetical protein
MEQLLSHLFGDYVAQSTWMALNKNKASWPCLIHCLLYTACFLPLGLSWAALAVIFASHFIIDRFGLARYVVWIKEQMAPWHIPLLYCDKTGYYDKEDTSPGCPEWEAAERPVWLRVWLVIVADNTLHLAINYFAIKYL